MPQQYVWETLLGRPHISMAFMAHIYLLDYKICKDIVPVIRILIQCARSSDENSEIIARLCIFMAALVKHICHKEPANIWVTL